MPSPIAVDRSVSRSVGPSKMGIFEGSTGTVSGQPRSHSRKSEPEPALVAGSLGPPNQESRVCAARDRRGGPLEPGKRSLRTFQTSILIKLRSLGRLRRSRRTFSRSRETLGSCRRTLGSSCDISRSCRRRLGSSCEISRSCRRTLGSSRDTLSAGPRPPRADTPSRPSPRAPRSTPPAA